jgi:hypothetical protein
MKRMKLRRLICAVALAVFALTLSAPVQADPAGCQSTIAKKLRRYKKVYIKAFTKCFDKENTQKITGPCPDASANLKISKAVTKATESIAADCTSSDLATLGFPTDCMYETGNVGAEAVCEGMDVLTLGNIDPTKLAACLICWKEAELREFIGILFASHVAEACGSVSSTLCSEIDCTSPLPDQRDLTGGGERKCQLGIAKGGFKYILKREKALENCALDGGTQASCLADPDVQLKLQKAEASKVNKIKNTCGNREPLASPPFCCKTTGNNCVAAADRDDCVMNQSGQVQEDKVCNAGQCDPVGGNKNITWWEFCPESSSCPGTPLSTIDDLITCVDTTADAISDELICFQFPRNGGADWPCPPD